MPISAVFLPHAERPRNRCLEKRCSLLSKQNILGLIDLRRQIGGAAVVGMNSGDQAAMGFADIFLARTFLEAQNLQRLGPAHGF